ncbi:hypothetical protein [Henriciella litoralis]|uniref:hypothetical protein n=1 Tax=Henriciella litoralis TaxID=568102 RepID=UPI000A00120B|nr:hypothetical protein [Henriciella litoralis]
MADIAGLAASAAGGGVFGLIGTALGRVAGYFETRQAQKHETERWGHETRLLEMQQAARAQETEAETALADISGSWAGLQASMEAEAAIGESYPWVNAVRGVTRPALTLLLWMIAAGIWVGADETARLSITETATFAATAATLWWFGDRAPRRGAL